MSPPDASALFLQLWTMALSDPEEPRPGSRAFDAKKWHRAWADCVALARTLRDGQQLGDQARSIAAGWGSQVP